MNVTVIERVRPLSMNAELSALIYGTPSSQSAPDAIAIGQAAKTLGIVGDIEVRQFYDAPGGRHNGAVETLKPETGLSQPWVMYVNVTREPAPTSDTIWHELGHIADDEQRAREQGITPFGLHELEADCIKRVTADAHEELRIHGFPGPAYAAYENLASEKAANRTMQQYRLTAMLAVPIREEAHEPVAV